VAATEIMLVDDYKEWRLKLRSILESFPEYKIVGEAGTALEAIRKAAHLRPDLILLDIGMPLLSGIKAVPLIRRASPESKIIFVTQEDDSEVRAAALATGTEAYLLKSRVLTELRPAIDRALNAAPIPAPTSLPVVCPVNG
jgi:two-component system nitrate/nitrite response regulator NarL